MPEFITVQVPVSLVSAIHVLASEISRLTCNNNNLTNVVLEEAETETGGPTGTEEKPYDEQEVRRFCKEKGLSIDSHKFYVYYQARGWKSKGGFTFNWKEKAMEWQSFERPKFANKTFGANSATRAVMDEVQNSSSKGDDLDLLGRLLGMEFDENNKLVPVGDGKTNDSISEEGE